MGSVYLVGFWSLAGQTPGMRFVGIRLSVDRLPLRRALRRLIGLGLSVLTFGIGFLGIVFGKQRRGWDDRFADTDVLYDERRPEPAPWSRPPRRRRPASRLPRRSMPAAAGGRGCRRWLSAAGQSRRRAGGCPSDRPAAAGPRRDAGRAPSPSRSDDAAPASSRAPPSAPRCEADRVSTGYATDPSGPSASL